MPYQVIQINKGFKVCKKGSGFLKSNINKKDYLKIIKYIATKYGYDPNLLSFANDNKHKLIYDGVKFGGYNNFDFIQYLYKYLNNEITEEELLNHRKRYLARATKIKPINSWINNPISPNNLARRLLWLA